jgi:hypothetical protein
VHSPPATHHSAACLFRVNLRLTARLAPRQLHPNLRTLHLAAESGQEENIRKPRTLFGSASSASHLRKARCQRLFAVLLFTSITPISASYRRAVA